MITITPLPPTIPAGQTLCIEVTGCPKLPTGEASVAGAVIVGRVAKLPNGKYRICFDIPDDAGGPIIIKVSSNNLFAQATGDVG